MEDGPGLSVPELDVQRDILRHERCDATFPKMLICPFGPAKPVHNHRYGALPFTALSLTLTPHSIIIEVQISIF